MKTRMELAKEFILEMEAVIDNMTPLDREFAKDRVFFKALLKKTRKAKFGEFFTALRKEGKASIESGRNTKEGVLMTRYLFEVQAKTDVVNAELTAKGRSGDKEAIALWTRIAGLVLLLNKEGGVYGNPIKWTVKMSDSIREALAPRRETQ